MHVLLVRAVLIGTGAPVSRPNHLLQPVTSGKQIASAPDDLVFLDLSQSSGRNSAIDDFSSAHMQAALIAQDPVRLEMPTIEIAEDPLADQSSGPTSLNNDAETSRQHLVGIYTGQIRARIERIWRLPRTPVDEATSGVGKQNNADATFWCEVTIIQDSRGWVQETQLVNCNGSIAWQHSLVTAINQASPLPAPPDPKVFARAITLSFIAFALEPVRQADQYELQSHPVAQTSSPTR